MRNRRQAKLDNATSMRFQMFFVKILGQSERNACNAVIC